MFLKITYLIISIGIFGSLADGQLPPFQIDTYEQSLYQLNGQVINIKTELSPEQIYIKLFIKYELKNISSNNLILWRKKRPDFFEEPTFTGKIVSKSQSFGNKDIIADHYGGPSDDYSDKYKVLRILLDKKEPPDDLTRILKPNESFEFTSSVTIISDKEEKESTRELAFETLKQISPIWIKVHYEVWSFNIEPKGKDRWFDLKFGIKLQKRWKPFGHLLLRDITSEPIKVDLSSAIVKTDSKL